ncbi:MAG TPA: GntR family transcriptional regulator [Spirochaetales bacterium]|nr:GntR family transcriptional regulator [Spirochaetales bacterium]HRY53747.1 GntR family transcriptional regulator [Spirochaetia bacterium]HRZ63680.1 GntR family transcriptional regulator [Spirochaetia bacterium]
MKTSESPLLYTKVKEALRAEILSGNYSPGAALPSERAIAEAQGVSLITAKRALSDLILEGLLERLPHRKGAFVKRREAASDKPKLIAVAIDDVRDSFGSKMLRGIEDYFWDLRIHTLICNADRDFAKVEEYFRSFLSSSVSGVIFAPVIDAGYAERNRRLVALLDRAAIPYTLIDRYVPGLLANYAVANHEESARQLTRLLLERGYRRIALARGLECTSMDDREAGYRNALAEAGLVAGEALVIRANDNLLNRDPEGGEADRLAGLLEAARPFDCLLALNDGLLRASHRGLLRLGLEPGEDVGLASHGEVENPALPCLASMPHFVEPSYEMGWEAAKILVEYIADPGRSIVQKVLKSRLVPGA